MKLIVYGLQFQTLQEKNSQRFLKELPILD